IARHLLAPPSFFLLIPRPPRPPLFPYTTLFRSGLAAQGLAPRGEVHWNLVAPALIQDAIRRGEGELADMGPFCAVTAPHTGRMRSEEHTSELQSLTNLVCRLLLEKKNQQQSRRQ